MHTMKQFVTWKCEVCDAIFEFDEDMVPLRCPDCLSTHDHLVRVEDDLAATEFEEDDDEK